MDKFFTFLAAFLRRPFVRHITVVLTGTSIAQAFSFISLAVISRLYSPAQFGIFGAFTSVVGVVGAGVTLQYSQALVLPKRENSARVLLFAALLSVLLVTCLSALFAVFFPGILLNSMQAPGQWMLLLLFPLAVAANGAAQVMQAWCIRNKRFHLTSASQMVRSASVAAGQIALGCAGAVQLGLMSGAVLGESLAAATMGGALRPSSSTGCSWWRTSRRKLAAIARRYKDFPLYATPQNVLNALSQGLPVLILAQYFGAAAAGFYALAYRLIQAPMYLVLDPLRQVLFQKATEVSHAGGNLQKLHRTVTLALFGIGIAPAVILFLLAPALFSWFLGEPWRPAGVYGRWLIVWLFVTFCNPPSVLIARILRQQRNLLLFDALTLVLRIVILLLGARWLSAPATVAVFSVSGAALNLGLIAWVARLVRRGPPQDYPAQRSKKSKGDPAS